MSSTHTDVRQKKIKILSNCFKYIASIQKVRLGLYDADCIPDQRDGPKLQLVKKST
jgi:hypothetical protein